MTVPMKSKLERRTPAGAGESVTKTRGSLRLVWRPHGNGWVYWVGGTSGNVFMAKYGYWVPGEAPVRDATGDRA